ncbi:DinB family protein [Flavobacterium sp.]|uniref:DinB family protein n=1 Tax=Flavobacterium sp. TaxID=239 RepID=UPI003D148298
MVIQSELLVQQLADIIKEQMDFAQQLLLLDDEQLQKRSHSKAWNILECLEHLNLYSAYYLPEISLGMQNSTAAASKEFRSGWLGNYFANSMLPKAKVSKMKTFKDKDPFGLPLKRAVIEEFLSNQKKYEEILQLCQNKNLKKIRIKISISRWISLSLGDTLRFIVNHQIRHFAQIQKINSLITLI